MYVQDQNDVIHREPLWHGDGWFLSCSTDELPSLHVADVSLKKAKSRAKAILKDNGFKAKQLYELESIQFYPHADEVRDGVTVLLRFLDRVPVPTIPRPSVLATYYDGMLPAVFRRQFSAEAVHNLLNKGDTYVQLSYHLMVDPISANAIEMTAKRLKYLKVNPKDGLDKRITIDKARLVRSKMNVTESFEELFS